jgi:hypothetical protein
MPAYKSVKNSRLIGTLFYVNILKNSTNFIFVVDKSRAVINVSFKTI